MTTIHIKKNRQGKTRTTFISSSIVLVFVFIFGQSTFAQGSAIEDKTYKKKATAKKSRTTAKKKSVTKKTKRTATPKKTSPKKSKAKTASRKKSNRRTTRRSKNTVLVTFKTEEPSLEIWRGEEQLGITDNEAVLKKWMKKGNYLVSVKKADGEILSTSTLISVSTKNKEINLLNDKKEIIKPPKPTAEELLQEERQIALDASEKIITILKSYGDPLKTNTISLADWEFVYKMAQANKLNNFTAIQIEAQRWFSSGQIDLAKGNYANAYAAFTKSVEFMPDSAYPYYALGEAYSANKQLNDAFLAYQKAVQIDPTFALAHRKIGNIHLRSNRTKESSVAFRQALENGFDTPAVRFDLAKSYLKNKEWDEASKHLEFIVKQAPDADVYLTLGDLYTQQKRNISAFESFKQATILSPNSAIAFFRLGEVLLDEREYERSKIALEKAIELDKEGRQINIGSAKKLVREATHKIK